jgi:hypothetical protein
MRDLYARLGIAPGSSPDEIEGAIARCTDSSVRSDAAAVLLRADRRRLYNHLHSTLSCVGHVRRHMQLETSELWRGEDDFTPSVRAAGSLYDHFMTRQETSARNARLRAQNDGASGERWLSALLGYISTVVVVACFGMLLIAWGNGHELTMDLLAPILMIGAVAGLVLVFTARDYLDSLKDSTK